MRKIEGRKRNRCSYSRKSSPHLREVVSIDILYFTNFTSCQNSPIFYDLEVTKYFLKDKITYVTGS